MKKRIVENSTTVETRETIQTPVPFKEPSGEIRENVKGNDFVSWFTRLLKAFKQR